MGSLRLGSVRRRPARFEFSYAEPAVEIHLHGDFLSVTEDTRVELPEVVWVRRTHASHKEYTVARGNR